MNHPTMPNEGFAFSDLTTLALTSGLTPWSVMTATAGLVAFHIGVFTLVGRERKSPYAINAVFPVFLLCLLIAALASASSILSEVWKARGLFTAVILLVVAFLWSTLVMWRVAVRFIYFVEAVKLSDISLLRKITLFWKMRDAKPTYSHDPNPIPSELMLEIMRILAETGGGRVEVRPHLAPLSVAVLAQHQGQASRLFSELAYAFLKADYTVQYLTASRHPIEFLTYLAEHIRRVGGPDDTGSNENVLKKYRDRIVVIDAYSSHFAFLDSIYPRKDREVRSLGISLIPSKATYAGMHSASSRAFKTIRAKSRGDARDPTLVIYEDCHALSDLESPEQYRIFVRHVMPSERMWGGMFTVFAESMPAEADWKVLQSYASMRLDYRDKVVEETASASERPRDAERSAS